MDVRTKIRADELKVGDSIEMLNRRDWWRWCRIERIGKSSTGGTLYFDGSDGGYRCCRASTVVEVLG